MLLAALLLGMCIASKCSAQCSEGLLTRMVDITHEGAEGVFLRTADLECLMLRLETIPALQAYVVAADARMAVSDRRYASTVRATELGTSMLAQYEGALSDVYQSLAELDVWWRSPWLWLSAGLVLGISGVTAAVVALQ